jgi:hypothetical protein
MQHVSDDFDIVRLNESFILIIISLLTSLSTFVHENWPIPFKNEFYWLNETNQQITITKNKKQVELQFLSTRTLVLRHQRWCQSKLSREVEWEEKKRKRQRQRLDEHYRNNWAIRMSLAIVESISRYLSTMASNRVYTMRLYLSDRCIGKCHNYNGKRHE